MVTFSDVDVFHSAVLQGDFAKASEQLAKDASLVNSLSVNSNELHFIQKLIIMDKVDAVIYLLDNGANPNLSDTSNFTLLHSAADLGNIDLIKKLLGCGADIFARSGGLQPVEFSDNEEVLKYLESEMEKKDATRHENQSIEDDEAVNPEARVKEICATLKYDQKAMTKLNIYPLHYCVQHDLLDFFKTLITLYNWDPNSVDIEHSTPLHVALELENLQFVEYIFQHCKPDLSLINLKGENIPHCALKCSQETWDFTWTFLSKYPNVLQLNVGPANHSKSIVRVESEPEEEKKPETQAVEKPKLSKRTRRSAPKQTLFFKKSHITKPNADSPKKDLIINTTTTTDQNKTNSNNGDDPLSKSHSQETAPSKPDSGSARESNSPASPKPTTPQATSGHNGSLVSRMVQSYMNKIQTTNTVTKSTPVEPQHYKVTVEKKIVTPELRLIFEPNQSSGSKGPTLNLKR